MRAEYGTTANAISIGIAEAFHAERGDEVHSRAIVALAGGEPVEVQILYSDLGSPNRWPSWPSATASTWRPCERPRSPRSRLPIEP